MTNSTFNIFWLNKEKNLSQVPSLQMSSHESTQHKSVLHASVSSASPTQSFPPCRGLLQNRVLILFPPPQVIISLSYQVADSLCFSFNMKDSVIAMLLCKVVISIGDWTPCNISAKKLIKKQKWKEEKNNSFFSNRWFNLSFFFQ